MNTDHVQEIYPMWEGYWCSKCDQRLKNIKMWKCDLLVKTTGSRHKEVKYICTTCAATKEDAVDFFLENPQ
jgi:hypothetical protein